MIFAWRSKTRRPSTPNGERYRSGSRYTYRTIVSLPPRACRIPQKAGFARSVVDSRDGLASTEGFPRQVGHDTTTLVSLSWFPPHPSPSFASRPCRPLLAQIDFYSPPPPRLSTVTGSSAHGRTFSRYGSSYTRSCSNHPYSSPCGPRVVIYPFAYGTGAGVSFQLLLQGYGVELRKRKRNVGSRDAAVSCFVF